MLRKFYEQQNEAAPNREAPGVETRSKVHEMCVRKKGEKAEMGTSRSLSLALMSGCCALVMADVAVRMCPGALAANDRVREL